jgi:FlaA1/EpsC-like NDP-sugar epimerase
MENNYKEFIKDKKILVTGGTGSIGRVLVKELLKYDPKVIRILSRDATKQINFQSELGSNKVRFLVGDIKDADRLLMACEDVDFIFHAAAFKYVPQGEYNPFEVIQTNILGTQNLISAALKTPSVTHFVMISTDKAVEPVNTMGASKLLAERLVSAAHYMKGKKDKVFVTVRFGNVLGTTGSVIPLFKEQVKKGELIVTHPEMARFFMTIPDAVNLVLDAATMARGGEVFVLKMPVLALKDLAEVCAARFSNPPVPVRIGAIRPGEKLNEALLTEAEARSALETDKHFVIIPPVETNDVFRKDYFYPSARPLASKTYDTAIAPRMSKEEISKLLDRAGI